MPCDGHHKMSDSEAACKLLHNGDASAAPWWPQQATDGPRCMTEKIMTHGMELDEVDGDKRNLATTILDDADLEAVSGGASMETTMYVLGINGLYQASKAAGHRR
jgi:hypothetical protein